MKLYTEEQLLNTIKSIRHYDDVYDEKVANERIEKHLKALSPIELPTDEEIRKESHDYFMRGQLGFEAAADTERAFLRGVLWMRDKITGGNK